MLFSFEEHDYVATGDSEFPSIFVHFTFVLIECKVRKKGQYLDKREEHYHYFVINVRFMGYWFCCGEVMIKTHHLFSFSTIENCQRFLPNCSPLKGLIVLLFLITPGILLATESGSWKLGSSATSESSFPRSCVI